MLYLLVWCVLVAAFYVPLFWASRCSSQTLEQRRSLIDLWSGNARRRELEDEFHKVDYQAHARELFWCRDPRKLYGPVTQQALRMREAGFTSLKETV